MTALDLGALGLPQVFSPADAADVLRSLGLTEITECALRTRAYRKQVPFHLNGRRIVFTVGDLREIAEGEACRPLPRLEATGPGSAPRSAPRHRLSPRSGTAEARTWRARKHVDLRPAAADEARR